MGGVNPVGTWLDPNYGTQSGTLYPLTLDADLMVGKRITTIFAPHQQATPNMTVALDQGHIFSAVTGNLLEVAAQSTAAITAPTTNPRIDRVVVDRLSGAVSVVTGIEAASPSPPAIPAGKQPVAQILLQTTSTAITNAMITDERDLKALGFGSASGLNVTSGTGSGLRVDSSNNLMVNEPVQAVSTNQSPGASNHLTSYVATASIAFTLPRSTTLWNGWGFNVLAQGGPVTITPNAADAIDGGTAGASVILPTGSSCYVTTDGAGGVYLFFAPAGVLTGTELAWPGIQAPAGYLLEYGQAVSRTTYAALFNALTLQFTGNTHSSTTIDGISPAIPTPTIITYAGMPISGSGIAAGTTIASVASNGLSLTLSQAATSSVIGVALVIAPHGVGDGSTTFNVPDMRGFAVRGIDNMGGTAAGRVTSGASGINGQLLGTTGGAQTVTLTASQQASMSVSGGGTVGVITTSTSDAFGSFGALQTGGSPGNPADCPPTPPTTVYLQGSITTGGGTASGGGQPHPNMGPTTMRNWIIKT